MPITPLLMDKSALAEWLCISRNSVDERVRKGLLPPGKMWGGKLMWIRTDVESAVRATFGVGPSEDQIIKGVRDATRRAVNAR